MELSTRTRTEKLLNWVSWVLFGLAVTIAAGVLYMVFGIGDNPVGR